MVILRVINPKAKLHMDMLVPVGVLKAPALWVWGLGFYWIHSSSKYRGVTKVLTQIAREFQNIQNQRVVSVLGAMCYVLCMPPRFFLQCPKAALSLVPTPLAQSDASVAVASFLLLLLRPPLGHCCLRYVRFWLHDASVQLCFAHLAIMIPCLAVKVDAGSISRACEVRN